MERFKVFFMLMLTIDSVLCHHPFSVDHIESKFVFEQMGEMVMGVSHGHLVTELHADVVFAQKSKIENFMMNLTSVVDSKVTKDLRPEYIQRISHLKSTFGRTVQRLHVLSPAFGLNATPIRQRRGILSAIPFFGTFVDLMWNGYQEDEIKRVTKLAIANEEMNEKLAHYVQDVDAACSTNTKNILKMAKVVDVMYKKMEYLELTSDMEKILSQAEILIHDWSITTEFWIADVLALIDGQLRPRLFNLENLGRGLEKLEEKAKRSGRTVVFPDFKSVINSDFSVHTNGTKIFIVIHVYVASSERLQLFRQLPIPMLMKNETWLMIEDPKGDVLAVDAHHALGHVVSSSYLRTCKVKDNMYACPNSGILRSRISNTCLGKAHVGETLGVMSLCHLSVSSSTTPMMIHGTDTRVFVATTTPVMGRFTCPNGTALPQTFLPGVSLVETSCQLSIDGFSFTPADSIVQMTTDLFSVPCIHDLSSAMEFVLEIPVSVIQKGISVLDKLDIPKVRSFEEVRHALQKAESAKMLASNNLWYNWIFLICAILFLIIIVAFVLYMLRKILRRRVITGNENNSKNVHNVNSGRRGEEDKPLTLPDPI